MSRYLPVLTVDQVRKEDREVPEGWSYKLAEERCREYIGNIVDAHKANDYPLMKELRWAQISLSKQGARTDKRKQPTFSQFVRNLGMSTSQAYRLLHKFDILLNLVPEGEERYELDSSGERKPLPHGDDVEMDEPRPQDPEPTPGGPLPHGDEVGEQKAYEDIRARDLELESKSKSEEYFAELEGSLSALGPPPEFEVEAAAATVKLLRRIQRRASALATEIARQYQDVDREPEDQRLYDWLKSQFAERHPFPLDMRIESKPLWALVNRAKMVGDAEGFLLILLDTYYDLTQSADQFWSKQPFLPRALGGKLFERVVPHIQSKSNGRMTEEQLAGLKEIYGEG